MNTHTKEKMIHDARMPEWVRTRGLYVPENKPLKDWTNEELRRALCPKSGGRVEACKDCKGKCIFGFMLMGRTKKEDMQP